MCLEIFLLGQIFWSSNPIFLHLDTTSRTPASAIIFLQMLHYKPNPVLEILDVLFEKARQSGIVILLNLHRLHKEYIPELWYSPYDDTYSTDVFFETWFTMLDRYSDHPNLLGIDLLNEPHGRATFGSNDVNTDWKLFIEYAVPKITQRYPSAQWLIFVEGIEWGHIFSFSYPF